MAKNDLWINFKSSGVYELRMKFKGMETIDLAEPLKQSAEMVRASAVVFCPADTGRLRRSIATEVNDKEAIVGTNVVYAPYVEYGTGLFATYGDGRKDVPWRYKDDLGNWHTTLGMKPRPFMSRALQSNKEKIRNVFKKYVEDKITNKEVKK